MSRLFEKLHENEVPTGNRRALRKGLIDTGGMDLFEFASRQRQAAEVDEPCPMTPAPGEAPFPANEPTPETAIPNERKSASPASRRNGAALRGGALRPVLMHSQSSLESGTSRRGIGRRIVAGVLVLFVVLFVFSLFRMLIGSTPQPADNLRTDASVESSAASVPVAEAPPPSTRAAPSPSIPAPSPVSPPIAERLSRATLDAAAFPISGLRAISKGNGLVLIFNKGVFARTDQLSSEGKSLLQKVGARLKTVGPARVTVWGHTDNDPVPSQRKYKDNRELGLLRAQVAMDVLRESSGLPESRFRVDSRGAENPPHPNTTPESKRKNRTVTIEIQPTASGV